MANYARELEWIDDQQNELCRRVRTWAGINSGTYNVVGLARMAEALQEAFAALGGEASLIDLPPHETIGPDGSVTQRPLGQLLRIRKRRGAPLRVLLCIHADTVYGHDDPFQFVTQVDADTLNGPGVADAKGGLAIMLTALEAFERSALASKLDWDVVINPDEEIGSPGSAQLFDGAARENDLGLLFEPCMPDGALVSERKGSGNFTAVVRGRAAHAGRDFHAGRSATVAMAHLIVELDRINEVLPGVTVNVGRVEGGGAVNVVPDLALCRVNVRTSVPADEAHVAEHLSRAAADVGRRDGIRVELHGGFTSPPKLVDDPTRALLRAAVDCGREIGLDLTWRASGGTCDGNRLAAAGLPNLDTLGPRGGHIHSNKEYLLLDSLTERAKLTALLLMKLAAGEIEWPRRYDRT